MALNKGRWEIYTDEDGQWRFRLKARNGKIVLASEGYHNRADAVHTVELIAELVLSGSEVVDKEPV